MRMPQLWGLSASGPGTLRAWARTLVDRLEPDEFRPADVGRSLAGFDADGWRAAVAADDRDGYLRALRALADASGAPGLVEGAPGAGRVVFVFPGNGSQWPGMAAELMAGAPVFRAAMEKCEEALAPFVEWSLLEVIHGAPGAPG